MVMENEEAVLSRRSRFGDNPGALQMACYVPKRLPPHSPLVVILHGGNQTASEYAIGAGWVTLADRLGFALLCPEQTRANNTLLCFNWFNPADVRRDHGEAASIHQMVQTMIADHDVAADLVFITGLSAGAAMTAVMLATYPEVFAAGAMISGLPFGAASNLWEAFCAMNFGCGVNGLEWGDNVRRASPSASWPNVSIWHGSLDETVRPGASDALVQQWTNVHGLNGTPTSGVTGDGRTYLVWCAADGQRKVEYHTIVGMGHGTPLKTGGASGCGTAGPYLIEVGISSSLEIANTWFAASHPQRTA